MKNRYAIYRVLCSSVLSTLLLLVASSCGKTDLEDVVGNPAEYSSVYLRQAVDPSISYLFTVDDDLKEIALNVNYGGVDVPKKDIHVRLEALPSLVDGFNSENSTHYPELPAAAYSLEDIELIIPKGKLYSNSLLVKVNMLKLPGIAPHLLPVGITTVSEGSTKSEKLGVAYLLISGTFTKNPYPFFTRDNWTITASSTNGANAASRLLDGENTTYWSSALTAARPHEITVDLGESKMIHGCTIDARRATADNAYARDQGNPTEVEVLTSANGVDWEYSDEFALSYKSAPVLDYLDKPIEILYLNYAQQARYVKIRVKAAMGVNYTWFSELNIF